jgi:hypothetical protein
MYFKEFPKFLYDFQYNGNTKTSIVTDITRNVRFRKEVLANVGLYDEYDIVDGETPEIIAEKVYGNPEYHWIIMLANERYDYISDFPLDSTSLISHTTQKYNPGCVSVDWYIDSTLGAIKFKMDNANGAFEPSTFTSTVYVTISGTTSDGDFTLTDTCSPDHESHFYLDYLSQYFTLIPSHGYTLPTGTPVGQLSIQTVGRQNNVLYYKNASGFKVTSDVSGAVAITGVQEEERINESKRRIKIISPTVISAILKQYRENL